MNSWMTKQGVVEALNKLFTKGSHEKTHRWAVHVVTASQTELSGLIKDLLMINQVSVDQGNNHWEELEKASLNCKKNNNQKTD